MWTAEDSTQTFIGRYFQTYLHGQVRAASLIVHFGNTVQNIGQLEVGGNIAGCHVLSRLCNGESGSIGFVSNPVQWALSAMNKKDDFIIDK